MAAGSRSPGVEPVQPAGVHAVGGTPRSRPARGWPSGSRGRVRDGRRRPRDRARRTDDRAPRRLPSTSPGDQAVADVRRRPHLRTAVEAPPPSTTKSCSAPSRVSGVTSPAALCRSGSCHRPRRRARAAASPGRGPRTPRATSRDLPAEPDDQRGVGTWPRRAGASRSSIVDSGRGCVSGRSTANGCGSKVTTTRRPRSRGHLARPERRAGDRGAPRRSCRWSRPCDPGRREPRDVTPDRTARASHTVGARGAGGSAPKAHIAVRL